MSPYTHIIAAAVSAMLGFYVGHGLATGKCDSDKLEAAKAYASQFEMARRQEHEWQTKYQLGVEDARKREKQLALDAAAAAGAAAGLRHTVAGLRTDLSNASADAVRNTADTALAVFSECAAEVGSLAAAADGHASDSDICRAVWPGEVSVQGHP